MKKIAIFGIVFISILCFNKNIYAQAHNKGDVNIDLGIGFGIYGTKQTSKTRLTADVNGVPTTIYDNSGDTTDGAASTVIPVNIEYGISDKIGLGVDFTYNNYFIDTDDKKYIENVRAYDYGLKGYFHPLNSDFYDLSIGLGVGMSSIKWNFKSVVDLTTGSFSPATSAKGTGIYYGLDIKNKFWFSNHIGAFINIGYKGYSYSAIKRDNSNIEAQINLFPGVSNAEVTDEFKWTMNGANIGIGLTLKF